MTKPESMKYLRSHEIERMGDVLRHLAQRRRRTYRWPTSFCWTSLALRTGLRTCEVSELLWQDIDRDRRELFLRGAKGGQPQSIPLDDGALRLLEWWRDNCSLRRIPTDPESPVFVTSAGSPMNPQALRRLWRHIKRVCDFPEQVSPHALRHSFATMFLDGGGSLLACQHLMRHRSIRTTSRYLHLLESEQNRALETVASVFPIMQHIGAYNNTPQSAINNHNNKVTAMTYYIPYIISVLLTR